MTSSEPRVFVWMYLPGHAAPVPAGVLYPEDGGYGFQYGRSYLANEEAISLGPDLPLSDEPYAPVREEGMPSSVRDALPDSWGRYVIQHRHGLSWEDEVPDRVYMLESGSNRAGALDFQPSSAEYVERRGGGTLEQLAEGVVAIESDSAAGPDLEPLLRNTLGTPGGSQPKAFVHFQGRQWLAKFSTEYDKQNPVIKAERAAIHIARQMGLDVPDAQVVELKSRGYALLMERFDRTAEGARKQVLSGNTVSDFHQVSGGSYPVLVQRMAALAKAPEEVGPELFRRLAFRIPMRIDDDHLRNVAVHWDGRHAEFTQAFDLCPYLTSATPAGLTDLGDGARDMNLETLVSKHSYYNLTRLAAEEIAKQAIEAIVQHREEAAEVAMMTSAERALLFARTATSELAGKFSPGRPPSPAGEVVDLGR